MNVKYCFANTAIFFLVFSFSKKEIYFYIHRIYIVCRVFIVVVVIVTVVEVVHSFSPVSQKSIAILYFLLRWLIHIFYPSYTLTPLYTPRIPYSYRVGLAINESSPRLSKPLSPSSLI